MTDAAGGITLSIDLFRTTLANCDAWQTLTETDNATDAKAKTYRWALPRPASGNEHSRSELEGYRPYCLVGVSPEGGYSRTMDSSGMGHAYMGSGLLDVLLVRSIPTDEIDDEAEADLTWGNYVGEIVDDLCGLGGVGGYLAMTAARVALGPYRSPDDVIEAEGYWQAAQLAVEW